MHIFAKKYAKHASPSSVIHIYHNHDLNHHNHDQHHHPMRSYKGAAQTVMWSRAGNLGN